MAPAVFTQRRHDAASPNRSARVQKKQQDCFGKPARRKPTRFLTPLRSHLHPVGAVQRHKSLFANFSSAKYEFFSFPHT
jgi:hypothetical protein